MASSLTAKQINTELAAALRSHGYSPVGKWLVKGFEESFVSVGCSKDAFGRCWRFTWQLGLKKLSPWFRTASDFRDVPGEVSSCELHWRDTNKAIWVAPFVTDAPELFRSEVQVPVVFDEARLLPPDDIAVVSNLLHRIAFTNLEQCIAAIVNEGIPWLEHYTSLARLAEGRRAGELFYFHLTPKTQVLIAA